MRGVFIAPPGVGDSLNEQERIQLHDSWKDSTKEDRLVEESFIDDVLQFGYTFFA
jgi:hypothetical protein